MQSHRDGLFRICPKLQYESRKSLEKLERRESMAVNEEETQDALEDLRRRVAQEERKNMMSISSLGAEAQTALPIIYGQTIQLQHVKSGCFVTLAPRQIAEVERDCMKIVLDPSGNDGSWFKIHPRFKTRSEGATVYHFDQCVWRCGKMNWRDKGGAGAGRGWRWGGGGAGAAGAERGGGGKWCME
jgi:hypothetical protein